MLKKIAFILFIFVFASSFASAEETFTVSGEINFQYGGDIYVCLLKMEDLRDFTRPHHELSGSPCKVIPMNSNLERAGTVSFTFNDVSRGTYSLVAYQDVNGNGEVDHENYEVSEPWGSYKPFGNLIWQKIKFDLRKDMDGIRIDM